ncbi:hypothetical protein HXZ81_14480 [Myroides odoratimimus]|uniref:hypothetical protein n=1 Tax=Myroides odoratimimus TaxID=76832 RepID=UPI002576444C|nr:hypothetical protein [Myroides odoratimimus]MDM1097833.1 hypothetical protein [Myroides odoratimimus]
MKLKIDEGLDPSKVFTLIPKLKKLFKPIKVQNNSEFIDKLLKKPFEILDIISEPYILEGHEIFHLHCILYCNIPIDFSAAIGDGSNCWIEAEKPNGESLYDIDDREGLIETLESLNLPKTIIFTEVVLTQSIKGSECEFRYKI